MHLRALSLLLQIFTVQSVYAVVEGSAIHLLNPRIVPQPTPGEHSACSFFLASFGSCQALCLSFTLVTITFLGLWFICVQVLLVCHSCLQELRLKANSSEKVQSLLQSNPKLHRMAASVAHYLEEVSEEELLLLRVFS